MPSKIQGRLPQSSTGGSKGHCTQVASMAARQSYAQKAYQAYSGADATPSVSLGGVTPPALEAEEKP
jgi:hypothetical protein